MPVRVMGPVEIRPEMLWPDASEDERLNAVEWVDEDSGDLRPPPAHVELFVPGDESDLGPVLTVGYDGDGAAPLREATAERVARTVRWPIPRLVLSAEVYEVLAGLAPLAERVAAGLTNSEGKQLLTADAKHARAEFGDQLWMAFAGWPTVEEVNIDDAFDHATLESMISADTTDTELRAMIQRLRVRVTPSVPGNHVVLDRAEERLGDIRFLARQRVRDRLRVVASMASGDRAERDRLVRQIAAWGSDADRGIAQLAGLSHTAVQKIAAKPAVEDGDPLPRLQAAVAALRRAWAPDPAPAAGEEDLDDEYDELLEEQLVDDHRRHQHHVKQRTCVVCGKPSRAIVKRWQVGKVLIPADPDDPHRSDTGHVDDLSQPPTTSGQPSWTVCGTVHARQVIDTDRANPIGGIRVAGNDELLYQLDSYRYLPDDTELPEVIVRLRGAMLLTDHSLTELARTVYTRRPAAAALHLNRLRADIARTAELLASIQTYTPHPRTFHAGDAEPHPDDVSQIRHGQDVYSTFAGLNLYDSPTHWEKHGSVDRYTWDQLTALGELVEVPGEQIIIPHDHQDPEDEV